MGYLNQEHVYKNITKLKDNECPICDGSIEVLESGYNEKGDLWRFNYKCNACGPEIVISIEGRVIASQDWETWKKSDISRRLKFKIDNCKEGMVIINPADFVSSSI